MWSRSKVEIAGRARLYELADLTAAREYRNVTIEMERGALLWPAAIVAWVPGYASAAHRHHCVQMILPLRDTIRMRGSQPDWAEAHGVLIRPDALHEVDSSDTPALIAFVDAESEVGAALMQKFEDDVSVIDIGTVSAWRTQLGDPLRLEQAAVDTWLRTEFLVSRQPTTLRPAIDGLLPYIRSQILNSADLSLGHLAGVASLSPSRLMHVFTEAIGVPLRPYILWLRIQIAAGELLFGATATEAAHRSGFADSAHLTRTFRRMLGTTPSELVQRGPGIETTTIPHDPEL